MAENTEENAPIDDHYLDLTLALRPLNSPPSTSSSNGPQLSPLGKREQQAIRRREAKERRDLKRKKSGAHELCGHRRRRRCLSGNAAAAAGGGGPVKGQNGHFGDGGDENRSSVSSGTSTSAVSGGNSSDTSTHSSQQPTRSPALTIPSQSSMPNQPTSPQPQHAPLNSNNPNLQQQLHSSSNQPSKPLTNEAKVVIGKPPKPNSHHTPSHESGLIPPQMPCVTTTGDGPKGKTITGFLYKYTKAEVSIVCVCHGASFSPAGFVEHAGGVNVEHPLKHIRVAPFPL